MNRWPRRGSVVGGTIVASSLTFEVLLLIFRPGWHSREHLAFIVWSCPLALAVLAAAIPLRRSLRLRSGVFRGAVTVFAALVVAYAWTLSAVVLTGGYALAFDANPFWCWSVGSLVGLGISVFWRDMSRHQAPAPLSAPAT